MTDTKHGLVPVLDRDGIPLDPCHPARARKLVRRGRAKPCWKYGLYAVRMLDRSADRSEVHDHQVNINPGSRTTGLAVTADSRGGRRIASLYCLEHRGELVKKKLIRRSEQRRNRRGRLRHRQPRFLNRRKPAGWLPPSILSRRQNILTWTDRLSRLYPITGVRVENAKFDTQKMVNPGIQGIEYQRGALRGTQIRAYVLHRDNHRCVYCSRKNARLELDHIVPESTGGTGRPDNLAASCRDCNASKGNRPLEVFLARRPAVLRRVRAQLGKPLTAVAHLNVMLPSLVGELEGTGLTVESTDAASTAHTRGKLQIEKSMVNDAAALECPETISAIPARMTVIRATGRGNRCRLGKSKNGLPSGREYKKWQALPPRARSKTTPPGYKKRIKRVAGIGTGDFVSFTHKSGVQIHGYGTVQGPSVAVKSKNRQRSFQARQARVRYLNHGYRLHAAPNTPEQERACLDHTQSR